MAVKRNSSGDVADIDRALFVAEDMLDAEQCADNAVQALYNINLRRWRGHDNFRKNVKTARLLAYELSQLVQMIQEDPHTDHTRHIPGV